jgi:hypothetical protein
MHLKLLPHAPRFANPAAPSVSRPPGFSSDRSAGWSGSRSARLDRDAIRLMEAEALRLAARAGQARIAAEQAADAAHRAMFRRAADAFDTRAKAFETLLEDA